MRGALDPTTGVLEGQLVVLGAGDPDFHVENAYLVARELSRIGLREVHGDLEVDDRFWIGWEGGGERVDADPDRRAGCMATRLRSVLDPRRRDAATRRALERLALRRGVEARPAADVLVDGSPRRARGQAEHIVAVHRSNPLVRTLKRLNAYSNNDVERLGVHLGSAADLADYLAGRLEVPRAELDVETLSGLGHNRLTPRQVVRLLRELRETAARLGIEPRDALPVAGCDPGTLAHHPGLTAEGVRGAVVAKTGTLTSTDGGIAVLAGYASTARGEVLFCVAAPRIGVRVERARRSIGRWLEAQLAARGGPLGRPCGPEVVLSDTLAFVQASAGS
jgi:D-alanyl-D-alanine carboxypeptidase/D-alanyl-D-alanine-endopeptidase (penicillin-binding protein 4)